MSYRIQFESKASKEFSKLSREIQERLADVIDDLANNPLPPAAKKLTQIEGYRVRKGDYRILYTIDEAAKVVTIYRVGHRREVYR